MSAASKSGHRFCVRLRDQQTGAASKSGYRFCVRLRGGLT